MRAMVLKKIKSPLQLMEMPTPKPLKNQILIRVHACGVCRTDLHIVDGELQAPKLPLILGHQIVGRVASVGKNVKKFKVGDRVGVPWLFSTCGRCVYCRSHLENLCEHAHFTGFNANGGFAEYCVANESFIFLLPKKISDLSSAPSDLSSAPLLCAGLIGYRALRMVQNAKKIGFYGFGSSAHLLTQIAKIQKKQVYAFTKKGDSRTQKFAKEIGAYWAGDSETPPPTPLDAAIIFAPVGALVPVALKAIRKAGVVVCAGIHMSDIPSFPYALLWEERVLRSVANLTRKDGCDFFKLIKKIYIRSKVTTFPLEKANEALNALRTGRFDGSIVITLEN